MKIVSKKLILTSLALAVSFAGTNVHAGDMGPVESVELWSGFYFGVHTGAGSGGGRQDFDENILETTGGITIDSPSSGSLDPAVKGSLADLFIGYNFHHPDSRFVFGGQVEGLFSNITVNGIGVQRFNVHTFSGGTLLSNLPYDRAIRLEDGLRSSFNFIARGGYLPCENLLLYGLGGVVEAYFVLPDAEGLINFTPLVPSQLGINTVLNKSLWTTGGTAGAGAEYKLSEHLSILAEYRYLSFHYSRSNGPTTFQDVNNATFTTSKNIQSNVHFNLGQIGIVYRC